MIEVKDGYGYKGRQLTINNSTFKDEQKIGQAAAAAAAAVSRWKNIYNKNHGKAITNILQDDALLCLHNC